ncbi:DMT family transporter [Alicyclobacillus vulcanalis]|uniref:Permease of the drug/metabolite transporter (DMT) superfamily n=1 Tax=Alicyclobacillus vulcanalis TaxID=252246 RepID=A0A1N7NGS1_9BACL|nr:DMT family transporter [Alicyclobacillus vulcanalis]SIS97451.1 Permease of the drug/metabolite transporter (DMT) superfamily [Alicyclobacillus vulcanalis]
MERARVTGAWSARALLIFVTFIWGATFTLTKQGLSAVPPYAFLSLRFALASLATLGLALAVRQKEPAFRHPRTWLVGALAGLPLGASFLLQTEGLKTITPGLSGFLTGLNVVMVPILMGVWTRQPIDRRSALGIALACAGLVAMCAGTDLHGRLGGIIETTLCALGVALQIVIVDRWAKGLAPFAVAAVEIWVSTLMAFASAWLSGQWGHLLDTSVWLRPGVLDAVVINGWLGTAFALWAQNWAQKRLSSAQTAITFSLEPVFAAVIGWAALGDAMSWASALGGLLIALGMAITPA